MLMNKPPAGSIYLAVLASSILKKLVEYEDVVPRMITPMVTKRVLFFRDMLYSSLIYMVTTSFNEIVDVSAASARRLKNIAGLIIDPLI